MKRYGYTAIVLILAVVLTGCSSKKQAINAYLEEQNDIMEEMMEEMHDVDHTGNAALDFLYGMIPHHESAVDMAESYLKYGNSKSEFKKLAEDIIATQKQEIIEMQNMIKTLEENKNVNLEQEALYLQEYQAMMMQHHGNHGSTAADLDSAFAQGMMMHHQMAVDMAQAVLNYTEEERVADFAKGIIDLQNQEIEKMQNFLSQGTI